MRERDEHGKLNSNFATDPRCSRPCLSLLARLIDVRVVIRGKGAKSSLGEEAICSINRWFTLANRRSNGMRERIRHRNTIMDEVPVIRIFASEWRRISPIDNFRTALTCNLHNARFAFCCVGAGWRPGVRLARYMGRHEANNIEGISAAAWHKLRVGFPTGEWRALRSIRQRPRA